MDGKDIMCESRPIGATRIGGCQADCIRSRLRTQVLQEVVPVLVGVSLAVIVVVVEVGSLCVRKDLNANGGDGTLTDVSLHRLSRDDRPLTNEERNVAPGLA